MKIKLKSISLKNFKGRGTHNFHAEFGDVIRISGRNKSGKSSVMDAYLDCITGKLADGSEPNSVRPHDENGNDLNRDDIVRELVFDIDGTETTVKKVTSQKWVKKRGTTEEVFEGNKTTYVIDGFESSNQKAFTEWQEKIAKADVLLMCSNARPFLNTVQKSTAEARKILENLAGFSTEKFIAENPKYAHIVEITKNHKIEDVLKQLRRDLNAQKKIAGEAKVKLEYEREREISVEGGIEIAELELLINALKEQIAELDKQETALDEAVKAYDEASSGVLELKFELNEIVRKENERIVKVRGEAEKEIFNLQEEKKKAQRDKHSAEWDFDMALKHVEQSSADLKKAREDYATYSAGEFDETELKKIEAEVFNDEICPTCGQPLPAEQLEEKRKSWEEIKKARIKEQENVRVAFEEAKAKKLKSITESGNKAKSDKKQAEADKLDAEKRISESEEKIASIDKQITTKESKLDELPAEADLSQNPEYQHISAQIAEKEAALNAMNNHSEKRAEIKAERRRLLDEISEKKAVILKYQSDVEQKEKNVSTLEVNLRNKNQNVADVEQKIDLLKDFSIEKNKALAEEINPHFKHFQFEFVEYTQEGNPVETLKLMCGGTSYFDGLNHGDRILTECDLVCGLQELNGLNMPVWLDDVESLDSDRIPQIKQQLILLEKTSDEKLKISEVTN